MSEDKSLPRVGITHGDINGIGYEVILKAVCPEGVTELYTPVIFGSSAAASYYKKALQLDEARWHTISDAGKAQEGRVNLVDIQAGELKIEPGQPTAESGRAALLALEKGVQALKQGQIDVLVTAPINKQAMKMAGFPFPGHTEYLEAQAEGQGHSLMMLCREGGPRVALTTVHEPVTEIAGAISEEGILQKLRALDSALRQDFALTRPRIAVLSLNPHAGDGGAIGTEEQSIITPAIEKAVEERIQALGPFAADGFFGSGSWKNYDAILAMYHDQGLAPFKVIAMEEGINFTAGLPFVRTSPDHGTGYDIVLKGLADPTSMRQAIYSAIDIFRRRARFLRASANPLRPQQADKPKRHKQSEKIKEASTPARTDAETLDNQNKEE